MIAPTGTPYSLPVSAIPRDIIRIAIDLTRSTAQVVFGIFNLLFNGMAAAIPHLVSFEMRRIHTLGFFRFFATLRERFLITISRLILLFHIAIKWSSLRNYGPV